MLSIHIQIQYKVGQINQNLTLLKQKNSLKRRDFSICCFYSNLMNLANLYSN